MNQVKIILSVDGKRRELEAKIWSAMNDFRAQFPEVRTLHFLNAAYFTKANIRTGAEKICLSSKKG